MVKRRRLETPSSADLARIESEFRRETPDRAAAPIAQVAAETADNLEVMSAQQRADQAQLQSKGAQLDAAVEQGLLIQELPLGDIHADAMIRDRTVLDEAELSELRRSIAASGLRLPIEVFELDQPGPGGERFGLLSGYRRLIAFQGLQELTSIDEYATIKALIRPRTAAGAAVAAMVEENEIRSELSQFERGRIAVVSAQSGAFVNTETAVNMLFPTASKSKRSKVRSFALIFEELGDMLVHPEGLSEKRGLRLAMALRHGIEPALREALSGAEPLDANEEWALLEPVLQKSEKGPRDSSKGGRPKADRRPAGWLEEQALQTAGGITIRRGSDKNGYLLHFEGEALTNDMMEGLMLEIRNLLENP
ncbi:MAG: ParB N-terminal domain-containing protein [Sedimentitalea sp.]